MQSVTGRQVNGDVRGLDRRPGRWEYGPQESPSSAVKSPPGKSPHQQQVLSRASEEVQMHSEVRRGRTNICIPTTCQAVQKTSVRGDLIGASPQLHEVGKCFYPYFTDVENESQRVYVNLTQSNSLARPRSLP